MTLLEQTRKAPGFKAYCRRRSTTRTKTIAQIFEAACRARQGAIRAYMKPRGINSVLKDQFYDIGAGGQRTVTYRRALLGLTSRGYCQPKRSRRGCALHARSVKPGNLIENGELKNA